MTWTVLIPLIARYGVPLVFQMVEVFKRNTEPTQQDWVDLVKLVDKSKDEYIAEAKAKLGIS